MKIYPEGKIVIFSCGEYSDFYYCGHVVTLKPCNFPELLESYKEQHVPENSYDRPNQSKFVGWLCAQQYIAEINIEEIHLGDYDLEIKE